MNIEKNISTFFEPYPGTPPLHEKGDYRCSVHFGSDYRLNKAKEQASHSPVPVVTIIQLVNALLKAIGIQVADFDPYVRTSDIDYLKIKNQCSLQDERDIVWMKFTKDGYLGVVATGNDINHDIPASRADYDKRKRVNEWKHQFVWIHNSSGILVHQLGKDWDESFVVVFPLVNIPCGYKRHDIERAIGNMLITEGVPIIDFYSHNY